MFISLKYLLAASCILLSTGCAYDPYNKPATPPAYYIGTPSFSADNKRLLFSLCERNRLCTLATYDLQRRTLHPFKNTSGQDWIQPRYSPDNTQIVFISEDRDGKNSQITIMNANGDGLRKITDTIHKKSQPSFSPNGQDIIFLLHRNRKTFTGQTFKTFDVFKVNIAMATLNQLTNYQFYRALNPFYLPDGERFVFTGIGPLALNSKETEEFRKKYKSNTIFVMSENSKNDFRPAFTNGEYSSTATISNNGYILFISRTNKMDKIVAGIYNYDLFIRKNDINTRLTSLNSFIGDASISQDGTRVVFQSDPKRERKPDLYVMNSDGSNLTQILLPLPPGQENLADASVPTLIPTPDKYQSRMANTAP